MLRFRNTEKGQATNHLAGRSLENTSFPGHTKSQVSGS